jgi:Mn2+/Fe2+ NRAMP family transporter
MGKFANSFWNKAFLLLIGGVVTALNITLLVNYL